MEQRKTFRNRNLFDYLANILCGKSMKLYMNHVSSEGFDSDFKKVVLVRYLSMSPDERIRQIVFDNQLAFDRMDCKTLYRYLIRTIPKQQNNFIRYIK